MKERKIEEREWWRKKGERIIFEKGWKEKKIWQKTFLQAKANIKLANIQNFQYFLIIIFSLFLSDTTFYRVFSNNIKSSTFLQTRSPFQKYRNFLWYFRDKLWFYKHIFQFLTEIIEQHLWNQNMDIYTK